MIKLKLDVEDYCNDCPYFELEAETRKLYNTEKGLVETEHFIHCKNSQLCKMLYDHMKNELRKGEQDYGKGRKIRNK